MLILSIDTTANTATCALTRDGRMLSLYTACGTLTHSETMLPMIETMMKNVNLTLSDVDAFAVSEGPGSFTGVRIGVCAVRALSHAWNKPALAIDSLEALAMNCFGFHGIICPILDARRGQVYCAAFRFEKGKLPERILPDDAMALSDFLAKLPEDETLIFLGDGLKVHFPAIEKKLGDRAVAAPAHMSYLRAAAACEIAANRADEAKDCKELLPIYLRAPQAERERNARLAAEGAK